MKFKKRMLKIAGVVAAAAMALSMAACGGGGTGGNKTTHTLGGQGSKEKVEFPLKEKTEFTFMIQGVKDTRFDKNVAANKLLQDLEAQTNVHINFDFLGDPNSDGFKLPIYVSSGKYGDVIWGGPVLNSTTASKYIASSVLTDITDYINSDLMPTLTSLIDENPEIRKMITAADGRIYTLPKIKGIDGDNLESPIFVNKKWLDKLGLAVPKTLDEFTNMLRRFKEGDPNGNGDLDEIPYLASTSDSFMNLEALQGIWGLATKDWVNDSYVQVKNGKVKFVPTDPAYKEYLKYMAMLYKEGLLWSECFQSNANTVTAKMTSPTCVVGCFTRKQPYNTPYMDDYVCILPPKAEGYETCWYLHPAINGSKNQFFVTDKCRNVNILLEWVDLLYSVDNSIRILYGEPEDGRYSVSDGKYTINDLDAVTLDRLSREKPSLSELWGNGLSALPKSAYANITTSKGEQIMQNNYELYKDVLNKELWPRPYVDAADAMDADTYTSDISTLVPSYRADVIGGVKDPDKTWDAYVADLNKDGKLDKYIAILQKSYDAVNK